MKLIIPYALMRNRHDHYVFRNSRDYRKYLLKQQTWLGNKSVKWGATLKTYLETRPQIARLARKLAGADPIGNKDRFDRIIGNYVETYNRSEKIMRKIRRMENII